MLLLSFKLDVNYIREVLILLKQLKVLACQGGCLT